MKIKNNNITSQYLNLKLEKIFILLIFFIISCNYKTDNKNKSFEVEKQIEDKNYEFKNLDSLFEVMICDTMTFYSNIFPFPKKIVGRKIDSNLFNKFVYPILDKNFDRDYGALCKKTLNDSIIVYFMRHGQNSVAKISLLCYNIKTNKFEKTQEIADYVGDEGIELILKSKVKIDTSIKIVSRFTIMENGKIETDSIYTNIISF